MALFADSFDRLSSLQQALDSFRTSGWLQPSVSSGGSYPPMNVFRKGDDFVIIAEVPGIRANPEKVESALAATRSGLIQAVCWTGGQRRWASPTRMT